MGNRIDAAEEYMKNLIEESFSKFKRGEWIGVVRAKVIE
jgi:hypothetical protein